MAKMPKEVMDLFNDREASKVMATIDAKGFPNVAPKGSLMALDEGTVAFADIVGGKTRANLDANRKVAVAAIKKTTAYQVKGTVKEFQTSGPVFDNFVKIFKPMGMTPKAVGIITVDEVYSLSPANAGKKLA
ncbi:MAG: pyridoxamine 5'-phosphate oxidase family protein [Dehalococcoidia bacterium]|nr:pyridoxamine 5'-phosphate oxidase family protein [Dehalococcoidia bacterium]